MMGSFDVPHTLSQLLLSSKTPSSRFNAPVVEWPLGFLLTFVSFLAILGDRLRVDWDVERPSQGVGLKKSCIVSPRILVDGSQRFPMTLMRMGGVLGDGFRMPFIV